MTDARKQGYFNLARFVGDNYGETSMLRCLTVFIPDGDEYVGQLLSLMNIAGRKEAWFTATDEQREARANIWQAAYRETRDAIEDGCMDCTDVADCIDTDEGVQNSIIDLMNNNGVPNNYENTWYPPYPNGADTYIIFDKDWGTDDSILCAAAHQFVLLLHQSIMDTFEAIDLATNSIDELNGLLDNVEGISYLIIISEFIIAIKDHIKTLYEAAWNGDTEDFVWREVWCYMLYCQATYTDITAGGLTQVFLNAIAGQLNFVVPQGTDLNGVMEWLAYVDLASAANNVVISAVFWCWCNFLLYMEKVGEFSSGYRTFKQLMLLSANNMDSDDYCIETFDACEYPILIAWGGINYSPPPSIASVQYYANGTGWTVANSLDYPHSPDEFSVWQTSPVGTTGNIWALIVFDEPVTITSVQSKWSQVCSPTLSGSADEQAVRFFDSDDVLISEFVRRNNPPNRDFTYDWQTFPTTEVSSDVTGVKWMMIQHTILSATNGTWVKVGLRSRITYMLP